MNPHAQSQHTARQVDTGLRALCGIAGFYRIPADPDQLAADLGLQTLAESSDLVRAAHRLELRARVITIASSDRAARMPSPSILRMRTGEFLVFGGRNSAGNFRLIDPITRAERVLEPSVFAAEIASEAVLITRRLGGPGLDPRKFGFSWFLPSVWRYRSPLSHVLLGSFFIQIFALVTPLFFQVIVDKVLAQKTNSTLFVLVAGLILIGLFDVILQFLRTYALSHTINRIDVELGQRLFYHLLRLPLGYFETRASGQTVARVRELESIRQFLTGQGLFTAIDLLFAIVFIAVLLVYSWRLSLIIILTVPVYLGIAALVRPALREVTREKFNRGAESQQFLVESVVGIHTVKSSAAEPMMQMQWEEKLAAYVRTGFRATMLTAGGQNAFQYVNRISTALILLFGAWAVMDGTLTVGELIAFNMIASQAMQPILRLSQVWQDFQQTQISVERIGDILNFPPEYRPQGAAAPPPARGHIEFKDVLFRYQPGAPDVLKQVSLTIEPGEAIGIVGPSGSGKSTLAKLIQRLYMPIEGHVRLDGTDLSQVDPAWLRRQVGVVLQESVLFNRTIHENIAFSNPALNRAQVMAVAKLAGADEFISKLPGGYDAVIEERGANLSGGQRQRVAIARALALNPPILIFDEATSALDYESERIIQTNMSRIVRNRTVIIIAHRIAAVRPCKRIVTVVDGRVEAAGTHAELLKQPNSFYARLWAAQTQQVAW
jgi:subfamily B ATP-binding cassette protein HlyB/CyaB